MKPDGEQRGVQLQKCHNKRSRRPLCFVRGHICIRLVFHFWFDAFVSSQTRFILSELSGDAVFSREQWGDEHHRNVKFTQTLSEKIPLLCNAPSLVLSHFTHHILWALQQVTPLLGKRTIECLHRKRTVVLRFSLCSGGL